MTEQTINYRIRQLYATAAVFAAANPLLLQGERTYESDTDREKIGDGVTLYNDLPYILQGEGTDLSYDAASRVLSSSTGNDATLPVATGAAAGLMAAADKTKLDSITVDRANVTVTLVRNNSGVPIAKGQAVYVTGSSGTMKTVALADASVEATSSKTIGVAYQSIAHNATGLVVTEGELSGINTNLLTEGALLWLSETTGELTTTRPTQPAHGVVMGWCIKQGSGSSGIIYIRVDNGQELEELHDVLIASPSTGQVLRRASDGLWRNHTLTASDAGADPAGTASAAVAAHVAAADPHPTYLTAAEGNAAYATAAQGALAATAVQSVAGSAPISSTGGTTPTISIAAATNSAAGSMSAADKAKLDGIAAGAEVNVNADWNAVSGDAQILNKPTIPAAADATPQALGSATVGVSTDYAREDHVHAMPSAAAVGADPAGTASSAVSSHVGAADPHTQYALESGLATVATSGAYADLSGKPSIPVAANDAPQALGTAAVGVSAEYAREDHVHAMPSAAGVGADPAGTAASAVSAHEGAADPHPSYALESSLGTAAALNAGTSANNVVQLDGTGKLPAVDGSQLTGLPATGDTVSIAASAADVLSVASGEISADDPGADRLVFWDDSAGKLTHLTPSTGLKISGTTITTNITTSTADPTGGADGDIWIKYTA